MSAFGVTADGRVLVRLDEDESRILLSLSHQFAGLLAGADEPSAGLDPALERLFPEAYRDDPDASAEFSAFTRTELAAAKSAAATEVQGALGDGAADTVLDVSAGWSWLRHLTDLRLTIAARLGVVDDPEAFDTAPDPDELSEDDLLARSVFDWLGYVQELLIGALEEATGLGNGASGPSSASA